MLKDILKSSFPYAYNFVLEEVNKGTLEIGLNNFLPKLIKKNKNINNLSDDDINSSSIALIFICTIFHIKINEDSFLDTFLNDYIFVRPNIKKSYIDSISNLKIQQLIKENKKIYNTIELNNLALNRQYYHHDEWFSLLTPLELSIDSIFNDTKQVKNIIDYLTLSYNAEFVGLENIKPHKKIAFDDYIVPACIIYKLGQAYNDAKKYYFKNNKENMYIELNQIRNKLNDQILKTDNCILELEETKKNLKKTTNTIKTVVAKQIKEKKS